LQCLPYLFLSLNSEIACIHDTGRRIALPQSVAIWNNHLLMSFNGSSRPSLCLPLLVTGITGVAGYNALGYFVRRHPGRVVGIRPKNAWRLEGDGIIPLDIEDRPGLTALFEKYRFATILNAIGNCALKPCELDPAMARQMNLESAATIAELARRFDSRLVHLSSDLVYSGKGSGNYVETCPVDPVTVYGRTMAQGEEIIGNEIPSAAILRISLPMGPSFNRHAGAIDWIRSRFRHGRPATLYFDEVRSCTYTDDLNRVFRRFLAGNECGVYHLGGPRPLTLYQIGQIVNRVGGYDPCLLKGCPRLAAGPMPPRAGNVSLCSDKLTSLLGINPFRPWPADPSLLPAHGRWHFERSVDNPGSAQDIADYLYRHSAPVLR
jgi:dTDP-4-dehydrorhamnose reductase